MNVIPIQLYRDRGLSADYVSDERVLEAEEKAWKFVETFCHQFFEKRTKTLYIDGTGDDYLIMPAFIHSITSVEERDDGAYDMADIIIYNSYPEDIRLPKIAHLDETFPEGKRNITVVGEFGLVDPNTSMPPYDLMDAVAKIVVMSLKSYVGEDEWDSVFDRSRLIQEQTDKWMYRFSSGIPLYGVTGVPEIDKVLFMYRRNDDTILGAWI